MTDAPKAAFLTPEGFKGHACALCGEVMPVDDLSQLPVAIMAGGKTLRLWMHRKCLGDIVPTRITEKIKMLPNATTEEIFAQKVGPIPE